MQEDKRWPTARSKAMRSPATSICSMFSSICAGVQPGRTPSAHKPFERLIHLLGSGPTSCQDAEGVRGRRAALDRANDALHSLHAPGCAPQ
jgi:hypothetical protein